MFRGSAGHAGLRYWHLHFIPVLVFLFRMAVPSSRHENFPRFLTLGGILTGTPWNLVYTCFQQAGFLTESALFASHTR